MSVLALLGPSSLLGQELKQALEARRDLWSELRLLTADQEEAGTLTDVGGDADFYRPADADGLAGVDLLVVAGDAAGAMPPGIASGTTVLVVSAPVPGAVPLVAGVNLEAAADARLLASPHPLVVALAHLLRPLTPHGLARATAWALQPASIHGQEALDELLDQTRSILAFSADRPQSIFGHQLAFNLLPVFGGEAAVKDLGRVLGGDLEIALQIVQAPVFHGCGVGLLVDLAPETTNEDLRRAIADDPFLRLAEEPGRLGPIESAARDEVLVGEIAPAPGPAGRWWIWAVMDNLTRGGALNAVGIVEALLAPRH